MSSVPPNMPPGGGQPPYPPYDPKTQWRVYREQQKVAWRAQRDAWKAQRNAWKAGYAGTYPPRVPSIVGPIILIAIGIIALLIMSGRVPAAEFWAWYGRWWPLLLIAAGLGLLAEWALDLSRKTPVRRSGSFIGLLVLLAFIGISASGFSHFWGPLRAQFGDSGDDFFNSFGQPEHDNDLQSQTAQIPANAAVEIENPRGDVSVTASDGTNIEVQSHEIAYADSDSSAKKIFDAETPHLTVSGTAVLVKSESNSSGRINLTVMVPRTAKVTINAGRGDVTAAGLGAGLNVDAAHGDVHVNSITGAVQVHLTSGKHDFSAHQVDGDLTANGDCNDLTLSDIKGRVTQSGEIFGEAHLENIGAPVSLRTSITEMQLAALPGDMTLNSDDLRVTEAKGPVHVTSHSKDIDLSQIYGDTQVEDRDGRIAVEPAGNYNIEAKNDKGDVEITLPPNASATVDGRTRNGDIVTDYSLAVNGDDSKTVMGQIGGGTAKINMSSSNGDLHIKKGTAFPPLPPLPPQQPARVGAAPPKAPAAPEAPHLKAPKVQPPQAVTQ